MRSCVLQFTKYLVKYCGIFTPLSKKGYYHDISYVCMHVALTGATFEMQKMLRGFRRSQLLWLIDIKIMF